MLLCKSNTYHSLLHVTPLFGYLILNNSWSVTVSQGKLIYMFLFCLYIYIYMCHNIVLHFYLIFFSRISTSEAMFYFCQVPCTTFFNTRGLYQMFRGSNFASIYGESINRSTSILDLVRSPHLKELNPFLSSILMHPTDIFPPFHNSILILVVLLNVRNISWWKRSRECLSLYK